MALNNFLAELKRRRKLAKISRKRLHLWNLKDQKLAYIQNYKVATRSIRLALTRFLIEQENDQPLAGYDTISDDRVEEKDNATKLFVHAREIRRKCPDHFVFTFVRHPLARLHSCYTNRLIDAAEKGERNSFAIYGITPEMSFEQFVQAVSDIPDQYADRHFRSQYILVKDGEQSVCDFVGKFESLSQDWTSLQERFALPSLPHKNKSIVRKKSGHVFSDEILRLVAQRYEQDFREFGYEI